MKQAIIDTDTLSYFFRKNPAVIAKLDKYLQEFGFVNISTVTYYEVLNGLYFKDAKNQLVMFEKFVEDNEILPLTAEVAKKAAAIYADLRKKGQIIGHNDVMIAGTAMVNDMTLISNNTNHFGRIEGLDLENWVENH
jgi:tRNA(fMet)-specific endonuclease VapC